MLGIFGRSDRLDDERHEHSNGRREEQRPATNLVHKEADTHCRHKLNNGQVAIDLQLGLGVGDADCLEHTSQVVRYQSIARPLGEQAEADEN